jgi:hypothetical protein
LGIQKLLKSTHLKAMGIIISNNIEDLTVSGII